jgi:hypothetical protein
MDAPPQPPQAVPASPPPARRPAPPAGEPAGASPAPGPPGAALRLAFSSPDEFLEELASRGPNLEPVLRVTFRWTRDADGAPVRDLCLVAGYLRRVADGLVAVTTLRHPLGAVWEDGADSRSRAVQERTARLRTRLERAAAALGLEVAPGAYGAAAGDGRGR